MAPLTEVEDRRSQPGESGVDPRDPRLSLVAVDLATTGLDAQRDHIIHIAAVTLPCPAGWEPVLGRPGAGTESHSLPESRVFSALVRPPGPVPPEVQRLTGIHEAELARAQPLAAAAGRFLDFLGPRAVVVHNGDFEVPLLERLAQAVDAESPPAVYDTLELARIALPVAPDHSLKALAAILGVAPHDSHDRLAGAATAAAIFPHLLARLAAYPQPVRRDLQRLASGVVNRLDQAWSTGRLLMHLPEVAAPHASETAGHPALAPDTHLQTNRYRFREAAPGLTPKPVHDLADHFAPGGALSAAMGDAYEPREGQVAMLEAVAAALAEGHHLLVEAGPGTGKSLAYLVPGVNHALEAGEPLIVSTHTIHLQEQLWNHDLPLVAQVLGQPFDAVLLKGRSHYLCGRRWQDLLADPGAVQPEERTLLARLITWHAVTKTGDRRELRLDSRSRRFWRQELAGDPQECPRRLCQECTSCSARKARRGAQSAQVVIVNHALLLADLETEQGTLPPHQHVICDEAHHLEDAASQHFTETMAQEEVLQQIGRCDPRQPGSPVHTLAQRLGVDVAAAVDEGTGQLELTAEDAADIPAGLAAALERLGRDVQAARAATQSFFAACARLMAASGADGREVRFTPDLRRTEPWQPFLEEVHRLATRLERLTSEGGKLLETLADEPVELVEEPLLALETACASLTAWLEHLDGAAQGVGQDRVAWLEARRGRTPALHIAPLDIGERLAALFFEPLKAAVLTSATLTIDGSFDYISRRLGMVGAEEPACRTVASPFDYRHQAFLGVATDAPDPRAHRAAAYHDGLAQALDRLIRAAGGSMLVLFTAHGALREVYRALKPQMDGSGCRLLAQGIHGGRSQLLRTFRDEDAAVLLGTASFWEGVDLPGTDLRCVVITRLPFLPPGRPLVAARCERLEEQGRSSFRDYLLPDAVLQLKQGFGRLIRRQTDSGAVIVLDPRIHPGRSPYGRLFVRSLPPVPMVAAPVEDLAARLHAFLNQTP